MISVAGDGYLELHYTILSTLWTFEILHNERLNKITFPTLDTLSGYEAASLLPFIAKLLEGMVSALSPHPYFLLVPLTVQSGIHPCSFSTPAQDNIPRTSTVRNYFSALNSLDTVGYILPSNSLQTRIDPLEILVATQTGFKLNGEFLAHLPENSRNNSGLKHSLIQGLRLHWGPGLSLNI